MYFRYSSTYSGFLSGELLAPTQKTVCNEANLSHVCSTNSTSFMSPADDTKATYNLKTNATEQLNKLKKVRLASPQHLL